MFGLFEKTDPESDTHWQHLAVTAFKWDEIRYELRNESDKFSKIGYLIKTMMVTLTKKNSSGWRLLKS